ncbi:hypothetical protein [Granulicella sp. S190]|uniref:hypothetical protein n=1 Tax=Granulicella sp. S190 TaxID=1747226 RepID=UPI00131DF614|nr:hypothetical protein [Granulicella sp. S190]
MTHSDPNGPLCDDQIAHQKAPAYFACVINDAERLMQYAAEFGIDVADDTRHAILQARAIYPTDWTEEAAAKLLAAVTTLSFRMHPVTAASLKAYHDDTRPTVRSYLRIAIILASIILPVSVATFITSAVSSAISADVVRANGFAVKLRAQLGPPLTPGEHVADLPKGLSEADLVSDLQDYASTVRILNARARKLNYFIIPFHRLPSEDVGTPQERKKKFELPVGIPDPIAARDNITDTYQDVRYFAQSIQTDVAVFYGAITTCILPVLYALLGTCAYLLRSFEHQMGSRTFTPSAANSARFLIAAIGGAVIGLFNNFSVTQEASIPPLALAFLVGYAVDVFFAFLEGLLKAFTKNVPVANLKAE